MALFSIPIMRLPASCVVETPKTLPVLHDGEDVAKATLRDGSYHFEMFRGTLQDGLTHGGLLLRPRYLDEPGPGGTTVRKYIAVEIVSQELVDLSKSN